jgi:hypothetical protein
VARRIIIALLCTLVLLGAARRLTSGKPRDVHVEDGDVVLSFRTVTEHFGPGQPYLKVRLEAPSGSRIMLHYVTPDDPSVQKRGLVPIGNKQYSMYLPIRGIGSRVKYAFSLTRPDGSVVRVPEGEKYYVLKFKGKASGWAIAAHVVFMFGAFFFMTYALLGAIGILRKSEGKRRAVGAARWALLFTFIGTWPLGLLLNWQTFGVLWEGYPFGRDVTDNKTQIVFVFWLVSLLLVRGSLMGRGEERDRLGPKGFAWAIVASFAVSLALYLLPHSL